MDIKGPAEPQVCPRGPLQDLFRTSSASLSTRTSSSCMRSQAASKWACVQTPSFCTSCISLSAFALRRRVFSVHYHDSLHNVQQYELPVVAVICRCSFTLPKDVQRALDPAQTLTPLPLCSCTIAPCPSTRCSAGGPIADRGQFAVHEPSLRGYVLACQRSQCRLGATPSLSLFGDPA